ncbi:MAG: RnfH family protein [Steroidobacteraceae bacterium]
MSDRARGKRCLVVYATRDRQFLWEVEVAADATVAQAIAAARESAGEVGTGADAAIPWEDAEVGIFGEICIRDRVPGDGDRIELYRPLAQDPKEARRERARGRSTGRSSRGRQQAPK